MSLNLTDSNRRSNYYLNEIDRLASHVEVSLQDTLDSALESAESAVRDAKIDIKNEMLIKVNKDEWDVPYSFFNNDVVAYYDFSSEKYLGRDLSGKNNHMGNDGVYQTLDVDGRKYSAFFNRNIHSTYSSVAYSNQRVLTKLTDIADFRMSAYTISLWFKEQVPETTTGQGSMFCINDYDNFTNSAGTYIDLRTTNNTARFLYVRNGTTLIDISVAATADTWHHMALTMDSSGNKLYVDGTLLTTYTTGSSSVYVNLSTLNVDNVTIGGIHENIATFNYDVGHRYKFPYKGYLSDIIVYNRALNADEITALFDDHIGYAVVVLAGQSTVLVEMYQLKQVLMMIIPLWMVVLICLKPIQILTKLRM